MIGTSGLSDAEIKRMVGEAEAHAAEDRARRELIEERNKLDSLIYSLGKTLHESETRVSEATRSLVRSAMADAKTKLDRKRRILGIILFIILFISFPLYPNAPFLA